LFLKKRRVRAAKAQAYRCIYCGLPVCEGEEQLAAFAARHRITRRAARVLQCTAEHLIARKDGGGNGAANIAAACLTCNQRRHRRKNALPADDFRAHVSRRVQAGRWHTDYLLRAFKGS
jgi:5-methylcytosine-specific restriction endonuclease McrA